MLKLDPPSFPMNRPPKLLVPKTVKHTGVYCDARYSQRSHFFPPLSHQLRRAGPHPLHPRVWELYSPNSRSWYLTVGIPLISTTKCPEHNHMSLTETPFFFFLRSFITQCWKDWTWHMSGQLPIKPIKGNNPKHISHVLSSAIQLLNEQCISGKSTGLLM